MYALSVPHAHAHAHKHMCTHARAHAYAHTLTCTLCVSRCFKSLFCPRLKVEIEREARRHGPGIGKVDMSSLGTEEEGAARGRAYVEAACLRVCVRACLRVCA